MDFKSFFRWMLFNKPNFCVTCEYFACATYRCRHPALQETDYITGEKHSVLVTNARTRKQDFCWRWKQKGVPS